MKRCRFSEEQIIAILKEQENACLKKLLADQLLDNAVLKDLASKRMATPAAKRNAVAHAREGHGLSERRACRLVEGKPPSDTV